MGYDDIIVKGNTIEFATEKSEPLSISSINGQTAEGLRIKMDLKIFIEDYTAKEWYGPYVATFSEERNDYVFKEQPEIELNPDSYYMAYAINDSITSCEGRELVYFENYYSDRPVYPVYHGEMTQLSGSNPYIKIGMREWTARLTVRFPKSWGKEVENVVFEDVYRKNLLPSGLFYISDMKPYSYGDILRCKSAVGVDANGDKYAYTFFIFPFSVPAEGYVNIKINFGERTLTVPCPAIDLRSGESKIIDINGLGIGDVSVSLWDETEGGSIIIKPNK